MIVTMLKPIQRESNPDDRYNTSMFILQTTWYVYNVTTNETKPILLYNKIHPKQPLHSSLVLGFFLCNVHAERS